MNTGIDFFTNLVGSTPIAPFLSFSSPPSSPLPFSYLPLPFLHPLSQSPILSSLIPFRHPEIQLGGLGKRYKLSPARSPGGAPATNAFARILG